MDVGSRIAPLDSPTSSAFKATTPALPSLSDMEAQRRQELLARKAVLASRRKKEERSTIDEPAVNPGANSIISPNEPASIAPVEAVDTFLSSMLDDSGPAVASPAQDLSDGSFRLDAVSTFTYKASDETATGFDHSRTSRTPLGSARGSISSSMPSGTSSAHSSNSNTPPVSRRSTTPNAPSFPANGKRGTKRPVAMDFVDGGSYSAPTGPSFVRRKNSSFAGLNQNGPRKCVIDLSDSEGEDNDGYTTVILDEPPAERHPVIPLVRPPSTHTPTSARGSVPPSSKGTPSPGVASGSLLEKEEQIKRMREMIQRREQDRLRRLAEVSTFNSDYLSVP